MTDRSSLGNATAPGEILELFKGGYLSIAETITALEEVFTNHAQGLTVGVLHDIFITMRHARTFITSREKMHPTGVELWDRLFAQIEALQPSAFPSTESGPAVLDGGIDGPYNERVCQCEHPMIKCDRTGCRCTLCGELERHTFTSPNRGATEYEAVLEPVTLDDLERTEGDLEDRAR